MWALASGWDTAWFADLPSEDLSLVGVVRGATQRRFADATRHRGEQDSFGVEAMEDVVKASAALPTMRHPSTGEVVVGDLAGGNGVAADLGDRRNVAVLGVEVDEEEREAVELARLAIGSSEEQTDLGFERLARPDLATVDDPSAHAVFGGSGDDAAGIGAGVGFGHPEGHVQVAGGGVGGTSP